MIELTELNNKKYDRRKVYISLCGKLEAIIGNYFLSGVGQEIETLYYDVSIDIDDSVELIEENIVAYYVAEESIAFVKRDMLDKLQNETEEYGITYVAVDDFYQEILCVNQIKKIPKFLNTVVWVDDDFMSDDTIQFDFEAFEIIDSKVTYLNPKHFSVSQMISVLQC